MWEESFRMTTVRPVLCRSTPRKDSRPVQSTLQVLISWGIVYWNHFCSFKWAAICSSQRLGPILSQSSMLRAILLEVMCSSSLCALPVPLKSPPPGKGFVESSHPSSSVQELDLLGYSLCCYCFICSYSLLLVLWIKGTVLDMLGKCPKTEYTPTPLLSGDSGFSFTNFHWSVSPH